MFNSEAVESFLKGVWGGLPVSGEVATKEPEGLTDRQLFFKKVSPSLERKRPLERKRRKKAPLSWGSNKEVFDCSRKVAYLKHLRYFPVSAAIAALGENIRCAKHYAAFFFLS